MKDLTGEGLNGPAQRIYHTLRIASAMCFFGHGAFGIITKSVWCNYFGVFGIGHDLAYRLMPFVGTVDILMGISLLVYPVRAIFGWLVCWGFLTASLRPLSGEPVGELLERAGNFGAPLALLLLTGPIGSPKSWWSRIDPHFKPDARHYARVVVCLRIVVFLLLLGHGWLNLIEKKSLLNQYAILGFDNPAGTAHIIGILEMMAALSVILRPARWVLFTLFIWKMATETFYPHWEVFEWIERGGSYGSILALWFALGGLDIKIFTTTKTNSMRKVFVSFLFFAALAFANRVSAQGCVAIRSNGGFCTAGEEQGHVDTSAQWQLSINNRYYKSFRHYVGTAYQKQRQVLGNEVINNGYTMDLAIYRILNPRWTLMLDLPISANARSQTYQQKGVYNRFSTHAFGAGDIRVAVYRWLLDPVKMPKGNIQVGLGLKFATGNDNVQDYFKTSDSTKTFGPVDQSIQLGDGGTGISFELNGYYNFSHRVGLYGNFFYLSNPADQNGISNAHGGTPSASSIANGSNVMSVPDQLMARAGVSMQFNRLNVSAGMRDDCLPVYDLIGKSDGFRRPGYIISAEPGLTYVFNKISLYTYVPIALVRNRTQSEPDKISTQLTGKYTQGDAAFANCVVNIGANIRF
ncbi:MAG TPA: hypothetical protein VGQ51_08950 [Puia sp.]|jgi:hypothetical protein|nr:hypothetical protein [Puia sp.]